MKHTVTPADVKRLYSENLGRNKTPKDARQGTRTEVHALIHVQNPTPLPLPAPGREFNLSGIAVGADGFKAHDPALAAREAEAKSADLVARKAGLFSQLTTEQILESEKARAGVDGGHRDAVHYVQKQHGKALWAETNRLVTEVLGGTP